MSRTIMTEVELNEKCAAYQKLLKLQDWDIDVRLVDQRDINGHDAKSSINCSFKKAYIQIPTADTWSAHFISSTQNMQLSLLHELIHVAFAHIHEDYPASDIRFKMRECAFENIAAAIIAVEDEAQNTADQIGQGIRSEPHEIHDGKEARCNRFL